MGDLPARCRTDASAETSADDPQPLAVPPAPRLPSVFWWGLATGVAVGTLAAALAAAALFVVQSVSFDPVRPTRVFVSPTTAGKTWFTVGDDGTGTLHGWDYGSSGSGEGFDEDVPGGLGYFDVATLDLEDGAKIFHLAHVYITRETEILIGDSPLDRGSAPTQGDALLGDDEREPSEMLMDRELTVEFHLVGDKVVADRIAASAEETMSPLDE